MPKEREMAQISRPFQIALVAFGLLVAVWFFALHGHSSTSGSGSTPAAPATPAAPSAAAQAEKAAAPSGAYHGSAPGVAGLTRAIEKAHGAVATSQQNAKQLQEKSAQASSSAAPTAGASTTATPAAKPHTPGSTAASKSPTATATAPSVHTAPTATAPSVHKAPTTLGTAGTTPPNRQRVVEAELKQGKIVLLLFWNPKGADDAAVRAELQLLLAAHERPQALASNPKVQRLLKAFGGEVHKKIAVHQALSSEVASFGTVTRGVQVYGTPTILVLNPRAQATPLAGLTDAFSIEQAIDEARRF
jgi:hypothetical protein